MYRGSGTTFAQIPSGTVEDLATIRGASATDLRITMTHGQFDPSDQYIAWNGTTFSEKLYFCENVFHQRMAVSGLAAVGPGEYVGVGPNLNAIRDRNGACRLEVSGDFALDATSPASDSPDTLYWIARVFDNRYQLMHYDGAIVSAVTSGLGDTNLVWASSPTDVFAIDQQQGTVAHFDGASWTVGTPNGLGVAGAKTISGSGPHDVWVAGDNGTASHFDGASWTASVLPNSTTTYWASWTVSPSLAFMAEWDGGPIQCWMGAGWSDCPGSHALTNGDAVRGFGGSGPTDVYAVGPPGMAFHWNGTAWSDLPLPDTQKLEGFGGSGPNDMFAVEDDGSMIHFDGATWSPVRGPGTGVATGFSGAVYANHVLWSATNAPPGIIGLVRATPW